MTLFTLAALAEFRAYLGVEEGPDAPLLHALRAATAHMERATHRRLSPVLATRACDLLLHDLRECILGEDLLELHACTDGDDHPVPLEELLVLYGGVLHRLHGHFRYVSTPIGAVQVTGIWGSHDDWPHAWRVSGDALISAVDTSEEVLPVDNVLGPDAALSAPRFDVGQLLRMDEEYMIVLAVDPLANTLTVVRGANGTPAASHNAATPIERFVPMTDIAQACLRLAADFYRQPLSDADTQPVSAPHPRLSV